KGRWTHVAWSWDGRSQLDGLKLYIDGRAAQTETLASFVWKNIAAYGDLGPSGGDWSFAQRFRDTGFKGGEVRDVVFASRALSALEVDQLVHGDAIAKVVANPDQNHVKLLDYYYSAFDEAARRYQARFQEDVHKMVDAEDPILEVSVMRDTPKPQPAYLLARGR